MLSWARCALEDRSRRHACLPAEADAIKGGAPAGALHLRKRTLDRCQREGRGAQGNDEASGGQHECACERAKDPMRAAMGAPRILVVVLCERGQVGRGVVEGWERGRLR